MLEGDSLNLSIVNEEYETMIPIVEVSMFELLIPLNKVEHKTFGLCVTVKLVLN